MGSPFVLSAAATATAAASRANTRSDASYSTCTTMRTACLPESDLDSRFTGEGDIVMAMLKGARGAQDRSEEATDAVSLLKADHKKVSSLLEEFEKAKGQRKDSIAQQICTELSVHAQIEEEIFYPAARAALGEEGDLIHDDAGEE